MPDAVNPGVTRRAWLALSCALGLPGWSLAAGYGGYGDGAASKPGAPAAAASGAPNNRVPPRLALLIGNRSYPSPFDLPPVHKNVRDLKGALEPWGFKVTAAVDQDGPVLHQTITQFVREMRAAPPDATVLFYFTGHGLQVDAENLLLGAGVDPTGKEETLVSNGLMLRRDLIEGMSQRSKGLNIVVIDACRTSLRSVLKGGDGLNQMEAPLGCLIAFATGAGKPAISPAVDTQNTFYTASLVKVLKSATEETTFSDLFRIVKLDVQQTMLNHPVPAIRQVAQFPFIAENTAVRTRLSTQTTASGGEVRFDNVDEGSLWQQVEASYWPAEVVRLSDDYLRRFPAGRLAGSAQVAREGASDAAKAMQRNDVRLYKSAFNPKPDMPAALLRDVAKSARGDKDAAARVARWYRIGQEGISPDVNRYEGWMQLASALGNGIASYELALYYRGQDQPVLAAQFETRARELGYTPPSTLDHYRK